MLTHSPAATRSLPTPASYAARAQSRRAPGCVALELVNGSPRGRGSSACHHLGRGATPRAARLCGYSRAARRHSWLRGPVWLHCGRAAGAGVNVAAPARTAPRRAVASHAHGATSNATASSAARRATSGRGCGESSAARGRAAPWFSHAPRRRHGARHARPMRPRRGAGATAARRAGSAASHCRSRLQVLAPQQPGGVHHAGRLVRVHGRQRVGGQQGVGPGGVRRVRSHAKRAAPGSACHTQLSHASPSLLTCRHAHRLLQVHRRHVHRGKAEAAVRRGGGAAPKPAPFSKARPRLSPSPPLPSPAQVPAPERPVRPTAPARRTRRR